MLILLPKKGIDIEVIENSLTIENLDQWMTIINSYRGTANISIFLPKFTISSDFMLNKKLHAMGMTHAFSKDLADFSGMANLLPDERLYILAVIHKAFVDVNEEGTEAAAATGVITDLALTAPPPPIVFKADHPFLFLIRDNATGSILFFGRVVDPTI